MKSVLAAILKKDFIVKSSKLAMIYSSSMVYLYGWAMQDVIFQNGLSTVIG